MGGRLCRAKWLYPHTGGRVTGATGCRREVDVRSWYSGVCVPPVTFCNLSGHCSNKLLLGVAATVSFAIGMDFVSSIKTVRKKKDFKTWNVMICLRLLAWDVVFSCIYFLFVGSSMFLDEWMPEILKIGVAIRHVTVKLKTAKVEIFK